MPLKDGDIGVEDLTVGQYPVTVAYSGYPGAKETRDRFMSDEALRAKSPHI